MEETAMTATVREKTLSELVGILHERMTTIEETMSGTCSQDLDAKVRDEPRAHGSVEDNLAILHEQICKLDERMKAFQARLDLAVRRL